MRRCWKEPCVGLAEMHLRDEIKRAHCSVLPLPKRGKKDRRLGESTLPRCTPQRSIHAAVLDASLRSIHGDRDWHRRRIANLSGGKAFNNAHCPLALRTLLRNLLVGSAGRRFRRLGQKAAKRKQLLTFPIGQPPEVSNARKPFRQDML